MPIESFHHLVLICLSKLGYYSTNWKLLKDKTLISLISIFSAPTRASDTWMLDKCLRIEPKPLPARGLWSDIEWTCIMRFHLRAQAHTLPPPVELTLGKLQYHWFSELEVTALFSEPQAHTQGCYFPLCCVYVCPTLPPSPLKSQLTDDKNKGMIVSGVPHTLAEQYPPYNRF